MVVMWRAALALLVGFLVFYVLAPTSGTDSRCYEWPLGIEVPCGIEVAVGIGAATTILVGVALMWARRRRVT